MLRPVPLAVGAAVLLVALVMLTLIGRERGRRGAAWLLAAWVVVILAVTLIGGSDGTGEENLVPGRTIHEQLTNLDHAGGVFNVLANVALFVPIGWLVALLARRNALLIGAIAGLVLSAVIEGAQALIGRVADIDDIILNGLGAALGAGAAVLILAMRDGSGAAAASPSDPR